MRANQTINQSLKTEWRGDLVVVILAALAASCVAVVMGRSGEIGPGPYLIFLPLLFVAILIKYRRPVILALLCLGFAFVNPNLLPPLAEFGSFSVRIVDAALLAVLVTVAFVRSPHAIEALPGRMEFRGLFLPLLWVLLFIAFSACISILTTSRDIAGFLAYYLRLIQSALFAVMFYLVLRDSDDVRIFQKAFIVFGVASVAVGAWQVLTGQQMGGELDVTSRYNGLLGSVTLGLISGLLVVYGVIAKRTEQAWQSILVIAIGVLGLLMAKSVSSILATCVATYLYLLQSGNNRRSQRFVISRLLRAGVLGVVAISVVLVGMWTLRPSDAASFMAFSGGSFAERLSIAYAGWRLLLAYPLFGIGWGAFSSDAITIEASRYQMEQFPNLPRYLYLVYSHHNLHNLYVHLLTETGLIGFMVFIHSCSRIYRTVKRLLTSAFVHISNFIAARFCGQALIYLLLWWNSTALFGGQTETYLAFTFIGVIAAIARIERQARRGAAAA